MALGTVNIARRLLFATALIVATRCAQAGCWAARDMPATTPDGISSQHPSLAPMNEALDRIEAMLRASADFNALPDFRFRINRYISGEAPRAAMVGARAYERSLWGSGVCDLIPQADRQGATVLIHVVVNNAENDMRRSLEDSQLVSFETPLERGRVAGWPIYNDCVLLTRDGKLPWEPVTVGDYLAFSERRQARKLSEFGQWRAAPSRQIDMSKIERVYEQMKRTDPQGAEKFISDMRALKAREPLQAQKNAVGQAGLEEELQALRTYRDSLSAEALAQPYHQGHGRFGLPADNERRANLPGLVKMNSQFGWDRRDRTRLQMLQVCAMPLAHPQYGAPLRRALEALDWNMLSSLIR